jgi:hypothetical protein
MHGDPAPQAARRPPADVPAIYTAGVEYQATNPPRPMVIGIFKSGMPVAYLDVEAVRAVVDCYDQMLAAYKAIVQTPERTP